MPPTAPRRERFSRVCQTHTTFVWSTVYICCALAAGQGLPQLLQMDWLALSSWNMEKDGVELLSVRGKSFTPGTAGVCQTVQCSWGSPAPAGGMCWLWPSLPALLSSPTPAPLQELLSCSAGPGSCPGTRGTSQAGLRQSRNDPE